MSAQGIAAVWFSRVLPELMDWIIYHHIKKEDNERLQILK